MMFTFVCAFLTQMAGVHPGESALAKPDYIIAFTDTHARVPVVHTVGGIRFRDKQIEHFIARQWMIGENDLILTSDGKIYEWKFGSGKPKFILDVKELVPNILEDDPENLNCSFDIGMKKLALSYPEGLAIIDMAKRKVIYRKSIAELGKSMRPRPEGIIDVTGISWNKAGTIVAIALPSKPDRGSTSGVGHPQCVLFSLGSQPKSIGLGAPVAWVNDGQILCLEEAGRGYVRPAIVAVNGSRIATYQGIGLEVGWDGSHALLSHANSVEILQSDLKRRLKTIKLPGHRDTRGNWPPASIFGRLMH